MIPGLIGGLLGAGGSVISGLFQKSQADDQLDMQKDFAQKGVQWKVADAKAAGVHPMAALGMQPFNFSPVQTGGFDGLGSSLSDMGANIDRAVLAQKSGPERQAVVGGALQLERGKLENDLLRVQIEKTRRELPPPMSVGSPSPLPPFKSDQVASPNTMLIRNKDGSTSTWTVRNPGLGQIAEDNYSDVGGMVFGGASMINDAFYNAWGPPSRFKYQDRVLPEWRSPVVNRGSYYKYLEGR